MTWNVTLKTLVLGYIEWLVLNIPDRVDLYQEGNGLDNKEY